MKKFDVRLIYTLVKLNEFFLNSIIFLFYQKFEKIKNDETKSDRENNKAFENIDDV